MTAALACMRCGAELRPSAKFCDECGSPTAVPGTPAEYKQVTVLFADVVESMDIAAAVGAERLREIMAELVDAARRRWCSVTAARWTSSPATASWRSSGRRRPWRTMRCARVWRRWDIQEEVDRLAAEVERRDGVDLQLRVGLNSGAGDCRRDRLRRSGLHRDR